MDGKGSDPSLTRLWQDYLAKGDNQQFKNYIDRFLKLYKDCIDINFAHLDRGRYGYVAEGPHHTDLPETLLQVLSSQLSQCASQLTTDVQADLISQAHDILSCFIVIARNLDNVWTVAGCDFMQCLVHIAGHVTLKLSREVQEDVAIMSSFVKITLYFFECLYDPYFVWRKELRGWNIERDRMRYKPAPLHVEVIPFFYESMMPEGPECFQHPVLDTDIQRTLFHVFGAIITGSQDNALKAICPATLDVLLRVLWSQALPGPTSNSPREEEMMEVKQLILKCLVRLVHVLHNSSPEQRQVEVGHVVEGYLQAILRAEQDEHNTQLQMDMLSSIDQMLMTERRRDLQTVFVAEGIFDTFVGFFHKITLTGTRAQGLAMAILRVMKSVMTGSTVAKDRFGEKIGYWRFVEALKSLGQPSRELLQTVLGLVVEDEYEARQFYIIRNTQAALMLIQWLPDIQSHELQLWLSECLKQVCCQGNHNRMQCCNDGILGAILEVLRREKQIDSKAVVNLIGIVECLGMLSITSMELKQLVRLLKPEDGEEQRRCHPQLVHAMSAMARKSERESALHYFDFQTEDAGISVGNIGKWPGQGFGFFGWLCLDNDATLLTRGADFVRRQLYSITSDSGSGFEAFFTVEGVLVIAVCIKKEFLSLALTDCPITDSQWHSVAISHLYGKRLFGQSQVTVFVDGKERKTAVLKFPPLGEPFSHCQIGSPGVSTISPHSHDHTTKPESKRSSLSGFLQNTLTPAFRSTQTTATSPVVTVQAGNQDTEFGIPVSLFGQLGSVCLFHEALTDTHVHNLHNLGPNHLGVFEQEESSVMELSPKLVLRYNAKASGPHHCLDLSNNGREGGVRGSKCTTWDIKDVINSIGGIQVIFPLFELVTQHVRTDPLPVLPSPQISQESLPREDSTEWVLVPSHSQADVRLERNQVAGFLILLRNLIHMSHINQEALVREGAVATLGLLLQKCEPELLDERVLMAIQLFVESVASVNVTLLHHIYQFLLFDFRIWSRSPFEVRKGHIQYLSTIIKDDKRYFRKKYGVQYVLDIIRTYYRTREASGLSLDDNQTIRAALFGLVKFYAGSEIAFEELDHILNFIVAVKEEFAISELLELLLSLLEVRGKNDQIYRLMFEPAMGELLYMLLTQEEYSGILKEKVLKTLALLLKYDKIQEKNKVQLRLVERGMFPGVLNLMNTTNMSLSIVNMLLQQVLSVESSASANAALSVVHLISNCDINIKLEASRKLLAALFQKPSSPKLFAKQLGWQEILVRLLILHPLAANHPQRSISTDLSNPQPPAPTDPPTQTLQDSEVATQTALDPVQAPSTSETSQQAANPQSKPNQRPSSISLDLKASTNSNSTLFNNMATPAAATPLFAKKKLFEEDSQIEGESQGISSTTTQNPGDVTPSTAGPGDGPVDFSGHLGGVVGEAGDGEGFGLTLQDSELTSALQRMGLRLQGQEQMERQEELCQNILIILFTVVWKGVEGCDNEAWKQRGQVFAAMNYTVESYQLLKPKIQLNRRLLELMLQGCIMDLKETGQTNKAHMKNCVYLVRWIYNFLMLEDGPTEEKYNERIIEDLMTIYDLLTIWDVDSSWTEMEQLGLRILLAYASQPDITLCSIAAAKLHTILQTRPVEKLQESCYVMAEIDAILTRAVTGPSHEGEQYSFLMPVMRALVDKTRGLLDMDALLPGLPTTFMSPTFYDDFKQYSQSPEWTNFMKRMVIPSKEQYVAVIFDDIRASLKTYIGECHEDVMVDGHKRAKERGESKLKFQDQIGESFKHKARQENKRYQNIMSQLRNQQASAMRQWRNTRMFFTGERGAWADSTILQVHWKLSNFENYSRMRPKLIPNYSFDPHMEASRLRDNIENPVSNPDELLPLSLAKEVKVADFENIGDDRLGDEEWNLISESTTASTAAEELTGKEKLVLSEDCELVTVMESIKGRLEVTTTHLYFWDTMHTKEPGASEDFKWALSQLREIHFRRYNLRRSALEFFLTDQTNYFLNFQRRVRNKVYTRILSLRPPNLIYYGSRSPAELLKASGLTQKWVNREISNFEYLMQLNTIAGRTYNDLSQYPVFPWILCDYTSDVLNLDDPAVYRDLSKPIGVVNPKNENDVREKYETFEDPSGSIEKFHYGTHYSNAAGVMHYLLRLEPFTTLHIQLQSGRFDVADRQFHSLPATWSMLMDSPNDVKELIPEFFYLPDFLENSNAFDLGRLQHEDQRVDGVELPKWAKSPEDFIVKHMRALESEHVSLHLHQWVDLIFGYKQKGPAAVNALNVFYYCTYEGAVDVEAITDPLEQKALEGIISNFGQTPCQLLKEAHPKRMSFDEVSARSSKSDKPLSVLLFLSQLKAYFVEATVDGDPLVFVTVPRSQARSILQHGLPDTMLAITHTGTLAMHGWLPYDKSISNYFTFDKDATLGNAKTRRKIRSFSPGVELNPNLFTATHDAKLVISGGHWDNSLRVYSTAKSKTTQIVMGHTDLVSCVSIDYSGSTVISGSKDTTCMIWSVVSQGGSAVSLNPRPTQILYGHDSQITCVQVSVALDVAASGSKDGTVIIHTVRRGVYMRTLRPTLEKGMRLSVEQLAMSDVGQLCVYCSQVQGKAVKQDLHLYSVNGKHLAQETMQQPVSHMIVAGGYVILGNTHGNLVLKEILSLRTQATLPLHIPITCLSATAGNTHILVALRDGKLIIVGIKRPSEVK